jgi:hypothetical protein
MAGGPIVFLVAFVGCMDNQQALGAFEQLISEVPQPQYFIEG